MELNARQYTELSELIIKQIEGSIDQASFMRLDKLLEGHDEAQEYYLDLLEICGGLRQGGVVVDPNVDGDNSDTAFCDIIEQDLAQLEIRTQASSAYTLEQIKRMAEQRLRESQKEMLPADAKTHVNSHHASFLRGYINYQRQRFFRPLKIAAACLIISLIGYFIFDRFIDSSPRLQYAINTYVVRGERTLPAGDIRKLKTGDLVKIGSGGNAMIQYRTENTSLQLDENTHFVIGSWEKGKHFELVQGGLNAQVAPQSKNQPLIINSDYGRSCVLGTNFLLIANPLGACLAVRSGCVQLTRVDDGFSVEVGSRQYALAAEGVDFETRPYSDGMDLSRNFWRKQPHATGSRSIAMEAIVAKSHANVEYYFECVSGNGHDSGWRSSPFYEDQDLQPNTEYAYRLKIREALGDFAGATLAFTAMARTTEAVTIEAETGEFSGVFKIGEDAVASNGQYLFTGETLDTLKPFIQTHQNKATYLVPIEKAGLYRIRGWCHTPQITTGWHGNSFYVVVDGQPEEGYKWDIQIDSNKGYLPDYVNDRDKADPVEIRLETGEHRIDFYAREVGTCMDRFELEYQPNQ